MARLRIRDLALTALLTLFVACAGGGGGGSSEGGGGDTALGPETAASFCDSLYGTFAQRWADCSKGHLDWASRYVDRTKLCANVVKAVEAGDATYDRSAAGQCLAFYEGATCSDVRAMREDVKFVASCAQAVKGKFANAGATYTDCYTDAQCASGRCSGAGAECPGMCIGGGATGQSCSMDRGCAVGNYCYYGSIWPNNTCQPYANRPGENQACSPGVGCQPGLYCSGYVSPAQFGACKPQLAAGACPTDPNATAPGYGCFDGTVGPLVGSGEPCTLPDHCGPGLYCGLQGTCIRAPAVGDACSWWNGKPMPCIGGYCNGTKCVADPIQCKADLDCESNGYCIFGSCQSFCAMP
jgi:hypothetical protein